MCAESTRDEKEIVQNGMENVITNRPKYSVPPVAAVAVEGGLEALVSAGSDVGIGLVGEYEGSYSLSTEQGEASVIRPRVY